MQFGRHLWHTSSSTQVPVSLSSGEAETYGVTKACSRALGMKYLAVDLGFELHRPQSLEVGTDSSAAMGVSQRRGSGNIRHLEAGCLWIQQAIASGRISALVKVPGKLNEPDILTKGVGRQDLQKHLKSLRVEIRSERSSELPSATAVERASS